MKMKTCEICIRAATPTGNPSSVISQFRGAPPNEERCIWSHTRNVNVYDESGCWLPPPPHSRVVLSRAPQHAALFVPHADECREGMPAQASGDEWDRPVARAAIPLADGKTVIHG